MEAGANTLSKQTRQAFHARLLQSFHQLLRFAELLDEPVHILHVRAGASRDAPPP
jgi:hypothetical protein